jgi:hypothetical protein
MVSACNSKAVVALEPRTVENAGNNLQSVVKNFKSLPIHENMSIDIHKIEHELIVPPVEVIINDTDNNESSDSNISDVDNGISDNDINSVEDVKPEVVVESRNLVTVYAQASSYMDTDYPGGVWYKVVWDKDLLDSYYGYCEFNPKGVYENEISVMAHGRYYSCDFSALTGYEKSQSGCSDWSNPKYVGGAIVSVSRC